MVTFVHGAREMTHLVLHKPVGSENPVVCLEELVHVRGEAHRAARDGLLQRSSLSQRQLIEGDVRYAERCGLMQLALPVCDALPLAPKHEVKAGGAPEDG